MRGVSFAGNDSMVYNSEAYYRSVLYGPFKHENDVGE